MSRTCYSCYAEIPTKRQNTGPCRSYQTGQICPYCFNTGFLPKRDVDRPLVTVCPDCNGEGEIRADDCFFLPSYKLCIACNGEKIKRTECYLCYKTTSMGNEACRCGSSNGELPPHLRRISLAPFKRRGKFAKELKKHPPQSLAEESFTTILSNSFHSESKSNSGLLTIKRPTSNDNIGSGHKLRRKFVSKLPPPTIEEAYERIREWVVKYAPPTEDETPENGAEAYHGGRANSKSRAYGGIEVNHQNRRGEESRDVSGVRATRPLEPHYGFVNRHSRSINAAKEFFRSTGKDQEALRRYQTGHRVVSQRDHLMNRAPAREPVYHEEGTYRRQRVVSWPSDTEIIKEGDEIVRGRPEHS